LFLTTLRLQPDLDMPPDGLGAAGLVVLFCCPGIDCADGGLWPARADLNAPGLVSADAPRGAGPTDDTLQDADEIQRQRRALVEDRAQLAKLRRRIAERERR
jgi:hypothetical protein